MGGSCVLAGDRVRKKAANENALIFQDNSIRETNSSNIFPIQTGVLGVFKFPPEPVISNSLLRLNTV